ncbi:MAG: homoserine dehydrogenase [Alphaproteobacteria bacterium]|nr:homoserine dehydrogenase [Alphaproteobacteria bacterium]
MMAEAFRLGIAGLGTVGVGVVKNIQQHGDLLAARCGRRVEITTVSARDSSKDRGVDLSAYDWVDNAEDLANSNSIDCVVEMIGGSEGLALNLVRNSLSKGKHVITANKALLAHHGAELAKLAEDNNVSLAYEAAIAGGVPIVKALREGFAGNDVQAVFGILNGTSNYMMTAMRETGRDFDEILKEAQDLGYAEADPSFDVDGDDAGHKLALLAAIAFGTKPDFKSLEMTGIRGVTAVDIAFATELGYKIKLLGIARRVNGKIMQSIQPCLVPENSKIGRVDGVFNAVQVEGDYVGSGLIVGRGAGEGPTASSVMSDVIDLARGINVPTFGIPANDLKDPEWIDQGETVSGYYLRLDVLDQPGVIADVSAVLRDHNVSIESFIQHGRDPDQSVALVMTTHEAKQADIKAACDAIQTLNSVNAEPCLMRIEPLE